VYAGSLICALVLKGKKAQLLLWLAAFLAVSILSLFSYVLWIVRDGYVLPRDAQGNYVRSEGWDAIRKAFGPAFESPWFAFLCLLAVIPAMMYLLKTRYGKKA
jgi:hypothetical protein